jgi:DNA-binding SARP family transcriptional activator/tetratricopeptide (TPR) repeat protein
VQLRLLGPVRAHVGDEVVPLGPRQQRVVLAVLALEVNRAVPVHRLIEWVWPDDPPRSAAHAVQVHVSKLRAILAAGDTGMTITAAGAGYVLSADPLRIDAHQFLDDVARPRRAPDDRTRVGLLDRALARWTGPALADIVTPEIRERLCGGLTESRLAAAEDRFDAMLRMGGHREVLGEITAAVNARPTRERLVGQLMLALYRDGQVSRALEVFRRTREHLADRLGIDPGSDLRRLEVAILRDDHSLNLSRPTAGSTGTQFVGRRRELAQLAQWHDRAAAGEPVVGLVEGVAGIGKTRLLDEFSRRATLPVVRGQGVAEEGAPPYWPWRQVFRQWLAGVGPTVSARVIGEADTIGRIAPELRTPADSELPVTAEDRFALFDDVAAVVTRMAADGLVIMLDDLHWADPAALLLFGHLARRLAHVPVLLVAAFRPRELSGSSIGGEMLAQLTDVGRLELGGLSAAEATEQLRLELGRPCDPAEADTVARRTGGNPLLVREIGRLCRHDPTARVTDVPTGAREAVRQLLSVLSPSSRAMLDVASVLSADIDPVALAAVSGATVEEALAALDEAVTASIVVHADGIGFRFGHDLLRDSLMLDVPPADRRRIHLRAAEHGEHGDPAHVARHRLAALPLGDPEAATRAASRAAGQAMSQLAYEDAVRWCDRGLAAKDEPDSELLIAKATAQYLAYDIEAARRTCEQAADLARRTGDPVALGRASLVMPDQMDPVWLATVRQWCEQALAELPPQDGPLRAKLLSQQVMIYTAAGAEEEARRACDAALAMAERLGDPGAQAAALRARQHGHSGPDGNEERLAVGAGMIELAGRVGGSAALWGHLWRFDALMQLGRVHEAEVELDHLEPVVDRLGQSLARWHLLRSRAAIHQGRGEFAVAARARDEAERLAERGGNPHGTAAGMVNRAFAGALSGHDIDETAVAAFTRGIRTSYISGLAIAYLYVMYDDLDRARPYHEGLPRPGAIAVPAWVQLMVFSQHAQIAHAFGDVAAAEIAYRRLRPYGGLHQTPGAGVSITCGSIQHSLGLAAATCGRVDAAVEHLRAAVAANADAGLVPWAAASRHQLAVLLHRRGDRAEAVTLAEEANATAHRLGMPRLFRRTKSLLAEWEG